VAKRKLRTKAGTVIDDAFIEALAAEAERGYDPSEWKAVPVGRPSLGGRGESPRVSFRATPELYKAAKRRAKQEGWTVSELAREAVARYVGLKSAR